VSAEELRIVRLARDILNADERITFDNALGRLEARLARLERLEEAARCFVTRYRMPGAPPSWENELAALESALAATEEGAEK
jgi:hypothetical protein